MKGVGPGVPFTATPLLPSEDTCKADEPPQATSMARRGLTCRGIVITPGRNPRFLGELNVSQPAPRWRDAAGAAQRPLERVSTPRIRSDPGVTRTRNHRLRRPTLYPVELRGR